MGKHRYAALKGRERDWLQDEDEDDDDPSDDGEPRTRRERNVRILPRRPLSAPLSELLRQRAG
jgi:hypothetical protein